MIFLSPGPSVCRRTGKDTMKPVAAVESLPRSGIREIFELALRTPDVIHLEVGEPDFPTPAHVVEAAVRAARDGHTRYTPNAGIPSLRSALADKVRERNGIAATPEQVVVTAGAVAGIFSALAALVERGADVLIADPSWPNYALMLQLLGIGASRYRLQPENGFTPTAAAIEPHVTDRTRAIVLNSPGNPTGGIIEPAALAEILELARRHDLWVLSDEVYDEIWFDEPPRSIATFDDDGRVITAFSMSKTYAMTGWRVGYLVAPPGIADVIVRCQEPLTSSVNAPAQHAAVAALTAAQDCVREMRDAYRLRRDRAAALMTSLGMDFALPRGAFYTMIDAGSTGSTSSELARRLVAEHRVAVAPGDTFGPATSRWLRISLASPWSALEEGIRRLGEALSTSRSVSAER
jgi:aspartate/methionine/tyrosine aminotransferase